VLQVGSCNEKADEWRLIKLNSTVNNTINNTMNNTMNITSIVSSMPLWAIVLGSNNESIACWDTGDGEGDPYKKKKYPLLKKPFPDGKLPSIMGCGWRKAGPKRFHRHHHRRRHEKGHKKFHRHRKGHKKGHRPKWFRHHRDD